MRGCVRLYIWNSNKKSSTLLSSQVLMGVSKCTHMFVRVRACVRACVCVRVCAYLFVCLFVRACVRACVRCLRVRVHASGGRASEQMMQTVVMFNLLH